MSLIAACFGGPLLRQIVTGWWNAYKARHVNDIVSMKLRNGRWRSAGLVHSVERGVEWFSYFGMLCVVLGVVGAVYGALK